MKKTIYLMAVAFAVSACASVKQIGALNMVSNRNVDSSVKYERITTYSGTTNKELKRNAGQTVEAAIDNVVRSVPGGEYLMNAKIYSLDGTSYFAVTGDVYGVPTEAGYHGIKVGDRVTWKERGYYKRGVVTVILDAEECLVQPDEEGEDEIEIDYVKLSKAE